MPEDSLYFRVMGIPRLPTPRLPLQAGIMDKGVNLFHKRTGGIHAGKPLLLNAGHHVFPHPMGADNQALTSGHLFRCIHRDGAFFFQFFDHLGDYE